MELSRQYSHYQMNIQSIVIVHALVESPVLLLRISNVAYNIEMSRFHQNRLGIILLKKLFCYILFIANFSLFQSKTH